MLRFLRGTYAAATPPPPMGVFPLHEIAEVTRAKSSDTGLINRVIKFEVAQLV